MKKISKKSTAPSSEGAVDLNFLGRVRSKIQDPFFWSDWLVVVAFIFVIAFFGAIAPAEFLTLWNLNNILVAASIPAIIAGKANRLISFQFMLSIELLNL